MGDNPGSPNSPGSPHVGGTRRPKSVRWTGSNNHSTDPSRNEDYFTYTNASGNRHNLENEVSSSSSDDDASEHDDEDSAHRRATTRANTWFNQMRQEEGDEEGDDFVSMAVMQANAMTATPYRPPGPTRVSPGQGTRLGPSRRPPLSRSNSSMSAGSATDTNSLAVPQIQISEPAPAMLNPYGNILDIGTRVSGGLAVGGDSNEPVADPLDEEYRQRRDELLATLGPGPHHIPASSPQYEVVDPLNRGAIPLQTLAPPRHPMYGFDDDDDDDDYSHGNYNEDNYQLPADTSDQPHQAARAEALRSALEESQSRRSRRTEEILAERHRRTQQRSSVSSTEQPSVSSNDSDHEGSPRRGSKDTDESNSEHFETEEELLRRLEDAARQDAKDRARRLVKTHLLSGRLLRTGKSKGQEDKGYVANDRYLANAGSMDDDILLEDEPAAAKDGNGSNGDSSGSSESLPNEKDSKRTDEEVSDSDSDDEENRNISMRGDPDYVPPPKRVKEGVLGSLLRLYAGQEEDAQSMDASPATTPSTTPQSTPLASPSLQGDYFDRYSTSPEAVDQNRTSTDGASLDVASTSESRPSFGKKWRRPSYLRSNSENALGRDGKEGKSRPKWLRRSSNNNIHSINHLASSGLAAAGGAAADMASATHIPPNLSRKLHREGGDKKGFDGIAAMREKEAKKSAKSAEKKRKDKEKALKKARLAEQARITIHIADVLQRQRFLLRLGRALMLYGAPSHRLEEYLKITARVLEIDAQVLYIPGCLLFSFGDATTHTSETKLLKVAQGLNLLKLHSTHLIYKEVVHDMMSLEEASSHIDHLLRSKNIYPVWLVIFFYGLACVCCGMFAYGAVWKDMPFIFVLGGGVGFLQFWVQPKSDLYANVFEVSSSIVVSFLGRAFGSIGTHKDIFCFAAIVQASLALILPGYIILVGALELQTKNLVAGSVRMFYANIYSLFLSFGITLGSAIYGWCDSHAVTRTTCVSSIDNKWKILFVPTATLFMATVNQASPRQLPVMVIIGSAGYAVQFFVQQQVENAASFTSAIGAFTLGVLGNLYSRVGHGLAFAAMLPGIFVLVPSGVAAQGSLVAGVQVATEIVKHNKTSDSSADNGDSAQAISELGNTMTQVAVGIVVGLFAATLVVYPLGLRRKRSGLFTF